MQVILTPELREFVVHEVESGHFASATAMIEAGLRLLQEQRADTAAEAHLAAIADAGLDWCDIHAGSEVFRRLI
jgi:putative addiction module CopG family antidote